MRSRRNGLVNKMPDEFGNKGSDFGSLTAPPKYDVKEAAKAERAKAKKRTDFGSLKKDIGKPDLSRFKRTATDLLIDALTPFLIFLMVYTVIYFLLDVRYIFTNVHSGNLRAMTFFMIMGVVALNRVVAKDNQGDSFIYVFGLGGVTIFYTVVSTQAYGVGSVARGFMNSMGASIAFNLTIVGLLWWVTNRLVHECCVDENKTAGDIGILTGTLRRFQLESRPEALSPQQRKKNKEEKKKRANRKERRPQDHLLASIEIEAYDPHDWKEEEKKTVGPKVVPSEKLSKRHPGISIFYFSVPVMIIFALGLPVLMRGGVNFMMAGHFYVGTFTVCALSLLMLTSLAGLRQYFISRRVHFPPGIGWFWIGLGTVMIGVVMLGALQLPLPALPYPADVGEQEVDAWSRKEPLQLVPLATDAAQKIEGSNVIDHIGQFVLLVFGLFLMFAALRGIGGIAAHIGRNREWYPRWVIDLFAKLDAFLERVVRLPEMPKRFKPKRIKANVAKSTPFQNPMSGQGSSGDEHVRGYIAHAYEALCALSADLGAPRDVDATPYEFLRTLPKEMKALRESAKELTELYVRSEYSELELDKRTLDRLRKFWLLYEKIRGRHVR